MGLSGKKLAHSLPRFFMGITGLNGLTQIISACLPSM